MSEVDPKKRRWSWIDAAVLLSAPDGASMTGSKTPGGVSGGGKASDKEVR